MAQFSHPDFAGSGQWMLGGMTMVSDLFNHALKGRVDALCTELSNRLAAGLVVHEPVAWPASGAPGPLGQASTDWWPGDLRYPNSVGSQNGLRYAYFAQARRLAIEDAGRVTVYDTLDHQIGGFSQAQGAGPASLVLNSQYGSVNLTSLPVVGSVTPSDLAMRQPDAWPPLEPAPVFQAVASPQPPAAEADVLTLIERLADLRSRGILDDTEFAAKKAELLARL